MDYVDGEQHVNALERADEVADVDGEDSIAVVGLAGRFPESPDLDSFWSNVRSGRDCLRSFSDDELDDLGIPPEIYNLDNFVRRGTILPNRDEFDARFFGYTPRQAAMMDPQARIFLETCYEALESAGYDPFDTGESVGVFAGSNPNDYSLLLGVADPTDSLSAFDQMIGVDRDFVATRVSHSLGLTGPAMTIQTACSTSLVTIHSAVQSLLGYECSMALAGGVSINLRQGIGYFYQQGMILSPTGECRAFDAKAEGTTLGQGCGVVALKRLADAEQASDNIVAIIRATAINNDGSNKISYTAPSEDGQAAVIASAQAVAGIDSDSVGYVETHGTGTLLGDPIEIAALTRAFRRSSSKKQFCAIGSAKTNFGHTDAAAGVTGFIKAVLALANRELPPSIHFEQPNPDIDFANSPFYVNTELRPWPASETPRRAGVSAFGIGGTNAHAVLEEAPARPVSSATGSDTRVLLLSGKSSAAADRRVSDLADFVDTKSDREISLSDVAFTLRRGRPEFAHRRVVMARPGDDLATTLRGDGSSSIVRGTATGDPPALVWLFAGQGAQYPEMGRGLYEKEPVFAGAVDKTTELLRDLLGFDLREVMFADASEHSAERLRQTSVTQPALFVVEHAMASLLRSWGLVPDAVIGHSIGEYAAAVEAGCFSWEDAARLVVERGRLMQSMDPGAMLAVQLGSSQLVKRLPRGLELAVENGPNLCVASGPSPLIHDFEETLNNEGISAQPVQTSHAFHSEMMSEAADQFASVVGDIDLSAPSLPMVSNVTGTWLAPEEATDPAFWASQIRKPVLFARCLSATTGRPTAYVELGPGRALSTFANANPEIESPSIAVQTMRHVRQDRDDQIVALEAIGRLWTVGVDIEWDKLDPLTAGRRVPLPTYPFERELAWLPEHKHVLALPHFGPPALSTATPTSRKPLDEWLYVPSWRRAPAIRKEQRTGTTVLLAPGGDAGDAMIDQLEADELVVVRSGSITRQIDDLSYEVDVTDEVGLADVFLALEKREATLVRIVHAWLADPDDEVEDLDSLDRALDLGLHSLLACARTSSAVRGPEPVQLDVVTVGAFSVMGSELVRPEAAALAGPVKVIPLEYSGLVTRLIDLPVGLSSSEDREATIAELDRVSNKSKPDEMIALRSGQRWTPTVEVRPTSASAGPARLRKGGHYLIVGGLGGVGLSIAHHLAKAYSASLVLTSRRGRPIASAEDDPETKRRIELLDEIDSLATNLEVAAVDAGDEAAMVELIASIEAEYGELNGVIVAAGVADQMGAIHRRSREDMRASLLSKVHGSLVLERALGSRQLDFVLLSSSIASVLYHNRFAQVGYVTANSFAEGFALRGRQRGVNTYTIAWDDWLDIGMSVRAAADFADEFGTEVDLVDRLHSFSPADGVKLFERALQSEEAVLLVSTTDLERRIESDVDVLSPFLEQATGGDLGDEQAAETNEDAVRSIWKSLLGFETFESSDDFFEIGGDSLQAARMADRLSRFLGVNIAVEVIFDSPTFGGLVAAIERLAAAGPVDPGVARQSSDPVLLSPGQLRFLQRGSANIHHFNTSVLLRPSEPVSEELVGQLAHGLASRHEALRLRLELNEDDLTTSRQRVVDTGSVTDLVRVVDLSNLPMVDAMRQLSLVSSEIQQDLHLEHGPIFVAALFQLPAKEQRLLLVTHHLMCDRVSLLLMIDALEADPATDGVIPATSALRWAEALASHADSEELASYADGWMSFPIERLESLPVAREVDSEENRNDTVDVVVATLDQSRLAQRALAADSRADELLLAALGLGLTRWADADAMLIDVLGHGRRLPIGVDVTGAVGMFLTYQTVVIDAANAGSKDIVLSVRDQLQSAWMFDVARFYGPEPIRSVLNAVPQADVLFNYVGRTISADSSASWSAVEEDHGPETDPQGLRAHALAVKAEQTSDERLELSFVYSKALHDREEIEALADLVSRILDEHES